MGNIDITKIALSSSEIRKLKSVAKTGPIDGSTLHSDETLKRLHDRGLVEWTYSDDFPYVTLDGVFGLPPNAIIVSDAGYQYLNRTKDIKRDNLITRIIAIAALVISALSLLLQFLKGC